MAILDKKAIVTAQTATSELVTETTLTNINPDQTVVTDAVLYTAIQKLNNLSTDTLVEIQLVESRMLEEPEVSPSTPDGGDGSGGGDVPTDDEPKVVTDP